MVFSLLIIAVKIQKTKADKNKEHNSLARIALFIFMEWWTEGQAPCPSLSNVMDPLAVHLSLKCKP
jgi:hypothetical protein